MDSLIKYVVFVLFSVLVLIAVDHSAAGKLNFLLTMIIFGFYMYILGHPAATQEEAKIDAAVEDLQKLMQSKESKITNRDGYLEVCVCICFVVCNL